MSDETKSCSTTTNAEPKAADSTVPMWIFMFTLVLIFLGTVYFDHHGGWFDANVYAPYASAEQLDAYQPKSGPAALLARGKRLYEFNCGTCHGSDGLGKPNQAPPLALSEWVITKGVQRLTHIPLAGINGPIIVEKQPWNLQMAAMGAALSDADLAAVLTYVRGSWGNGMGGVTPDDVKAARADIGDHPKPMTGEEVMKLPE